MSVSPVNRDVPAIIETGASPETSLIFIHGLGTSGAAFIPIFRRLDFGAIGAVRILLPSASPKAVSFCNGQEVPAWFNLPRGNFLQNEDEPGLRSATDYILSLIADEIAAGIVPSQIFIAGFSQGGALALMTSLLSVSMLGGVAALSGWLPLATKLSQERTVTRREVPVFIGHGQYDQITPPLMAETTRVQLQTWGHSVDYFTYPMGHTIADEEMSAMVTWMANLVQRSERFRRALECATRY